MFDVLPQSSIPNWGSTVLYAVSGHHSDFPHLPEHLAIVYVLLQALNRDLDHSDSATASNNSARASVYGETLQIRVTPRIEFEA
jgi:hypothetical protein